MAKASCFLHFSFPSSPCVPSLHFSSTRAASNLAGIRRRRMASGRLACLCLRREEPEGKLQGRREQGDDGGGGIGGQVKAAIEDLVPTRDLVTLAACLVGLLTGVSVVLFNLSVHEIRAIFWDGISLLGASWLRKEPLSEIWQRVIFVPICGGVIVGALNNLRCSLNTDSGDIMSNIKGAFRPFLKAMAASATIGTGNSLGPEGPSLEIGSAIAKGLGDVFEWEGGKRLSLIAAGSAAGISSGFNAAVAGCFFAVESVLWPSADSSSIPNSTPMVILSSVIASVVSEIGLGSDPAFTVLEYDFRSPSGTSLHMLKRNKISIANASEVYVSCLGGSGELADTTRLPKAAFPALGGLTVGLIALVYPEVLYWGFENVDILLESRPFTNGLSAAVLIQLVGVKVLATSLSRASGLVGGYYAPFLFIGAATGMAYGKFMTSAFVGPDPLFRLPFLEVASPQSYGRVGMAATLAAVCKVPLTSALLLFELTQDYRIVLPLLGAIGLSSWIASSQKGNKESRSRPDTLEGKQGIVQQTKGLLDQAQQVCPLERTDTTDLCKLESSLCVYDVEAGDNNSEENLTVALAMKTRYISVSMRTSVVKALSLMLAEKHSFVLITDSDKGLLGLLALKDIQDFCKDVKTTRLKTKGQDLLVSHVCQLEKCKTWAVTPDMTLVTIERIMDSRGVDQLPVVSEHSNGQTGGRLIGFIDRECIASAQLWQLRKFSAWPLAIEG